MLYRQSYRSSIYCLSAFFWLLASLKLCSAVRTLHQEESTVCIAFIPYRADDYEYMRWISDDRRRESFALARDRCIDVSSAMPANGEPWDFEGLKGPEHPHLAGEPESLTAFPAMNKRADDLYVAFLNACMQEATGVDLSLSVGQSIRRPYYFVHTVCNNDCSSLTPQEQVNIDTSARNARAVISCADTSNLQTDPFALALPFTADESLPDGISEASTFPEALTAFSAGGPVIFHTPQSIVDLTAAEQESEAPLEALFAPAALVPELPPGAFGPGIAPGLLAAPAPGEGVAQGPGAGPGAGQESGAGPSGDDAGGDDDEAGGVASTQTSSRDEIAARNISWILVGVGFLVAILLGTGCALARYSSAACASSCCECAACVAFIGCIAPVGKAGAGAAAAASTSNTVGTRGLGAWLGGSAAAGSSPALLGGAPSSSGDDSRDSMPAPVGPSVVGAAGTGRAAPLERNSAPSGAISAPQGAVYRTTSHSGSVSLAYLAPHPQQAATSNGLGDESSGILGRAASADSSALTTTFGTAGSNAGTEHFDSISSDRGGTAHVLGTVFELDAQQAANAQTAVPAITLPAGNDSEGLPKPLDEISAALEVGAEGSQADSLLGQGSGDSRDALLGTGMRSDKEGHVQ